MTANEMTDTELIAEIERLERLWNGLRATSAARARRTPTLFEVGRQLDAIDREWRLRLRCGTITPDAGLVAQPKVAKDKVAAA